MRRHEGLVGAYLDRLEHEARALHERFPNALDTIYLGGGTPSQLQDHELARIVHSFEQTWGWPARLETTLEADPLTFDAARLNTFKALGFNRLSIGVQSTQDHVLQTLGRRHHGQEGLEAVELALQAGFNVSADIITAVPGQDAARDLCALAALGTPHISVYTLTVEAHTPFARRGVRVDEDRAADDYALAEGILHDYGLERYEVSSHARPGFESQHNQVYWRGDFFLALGPAAAGFTPCTEPELIGERTTNPLIKAWLAESAPEVLPITPERYLEDVLMTGLRTRQGVDMEMLEQRTGIDVWSGYRPLLTRLVETGLLTLTPPYLRATAQGLWQLDGIVRKIFETPLAPARSR